MDWTGDPHDYEGVTTRFKEKLYDRWNIVEIETTEEEDDRVREAINSRSGPDNHRPYDSGGLGRYNCCDWITEVLGAAGLHGKYENPNPDPFGPQETPHPYFASYLRQIVDKGKWSI